MEEVRAHAFELLVHFVIPFSLGKFTNRVNAWSRTDELYSPLVTSQGSEQVQLCLEKCLTHHDTGDGKLPLFRVPILEYQISSVFASVVQALGITAVGINQSPVLGGGSVLVVLARLPVFGLVSGVVVNVHFTRVRILCQYIFIQFGNLVYLVRELPLIKMVLVHVFVARYQELFILLPHSQEYWRPLYYEANVNTHEVRCEGVENTWINVQVFHLLSQGGLL